MTDGMEAERSNCRCTYGPAASSFVIGNPHALRRVREFTRVIPGFAVRDIDNHIAQNAQPEAPSQPPVVVPSGNLEPQMIEIGEGTYVFAPAESRQGSEATRCAPAYGSIPELPSVSMANTAPTLYLTTLAEEPHPPVIEQDDGLYTFVQEALLEGKPSGGLLIHESIPRLPLFAPEVGTSPQASASHPVTISPQVGTSPQVSTATSSDLTTLAPVEAPPEIDALLLSGTAGIPISIVLCRNAAVSPLTLPDGCGCAFLGFFFVADVQTSAEVS